MQIIAIFMTDKMRLRNNLCTARRVAVQHRLLSFLMLIGILFGGVISPAIAHAREPGIEHVGEVLDVHEANSTASHDPSNNAPDMPGQPAAHHHCTIALEVRAPHILSATVMCGIQFRPAISRVLVSYAQEPPTEPPAA